MKALYDLNDAELDDFIRRAKRSLAEHAAELRHSSAPGDVRAAMDTIIGILKELQVTRPAKSAEIAAILTGTGAA